MRRIAVDLPEDIAKQRVLGLSFWETEAFLKERQAYLADDEQDLENDGRDLEHLGSR